MSKSHCAKRVARYAAFGAVVSALALSPLGISYAEPEPEDVDGEAPVTVTATVTAIIAPDRCEPLPDGRLPQRATDYATTGEDIVLPPPPVDPELPPVDAPPPAPELFVGTGFTFPLAPADEIGGGGSPSEGDPADKEGSGMVEGEGPFDPYLCDPAAAAPETVTVTPEPVAPGPALEDLPGVTPTLRPYPSGGGLTDGPVGTAGPQLGAPDADARPTEEPLPSEQGIGGAGTGGALAPAPRPIS